MTPPTIPHCPSCSAPTPTGNFCSACGASLARSRCRACSADVPPAARYCSGCGTPVGAALARPVAASGTFWVYAVAGAALLGLVLFLLVQRAPSGAQQLASAEAAPDAAGVPPDISSMSPRERFDRLYNRIMRAAESGDEGTVSRFTPMALMAYAQLPDIDADARYHAALIKVHTGDAMGARALGDTILAQSPGHLFGYMVRGTVARWQKDEKNLAAAYTDFLRHHDAELKAGRSEYGEHSRALTDFRTAAQGVRRR